MEFQWMYVPLVDLELPFLTKKMSYNETTISRKSEPILMGESQSFSNFSDVNETQLESDSEFSTLSELGIQTNNNSDNNQTKNYVTTDFWANFNWGSAFAFSIVSTFMVGMTAASKTKDPKTKLKVSLIMWGIEGAIIGLLFLNLRKWTARQKWDNLTDKVNRIAFFLGLTFAFMALGMFIMGAFGISSMPYPFYIIQIPFWVNTFLTLLRLVLNYINVIYEPQILEDMLKINLLAFYLSVISTSNKVEDEDVRRQYSMFGFICLLAAGVTFCWWLSEIRRDQESKLEFIPILFGYLSV